MRDAKEIIEDMRTIVRPAMMSFLEKLNYQDMGDSDKKECCEEFDYILELAEKGVDKAAAQKPFKTVQDVISDLEHQMMVTGAGEIKMKYEFDHDPYTFEVSLKMVDQRDAEVEDGQ